MGGPNSNALRAYAHDNTRECDIHTEVAGADSVILSPAWDRPAQARQSPVPVPARPSTSQQEPEQQRSANIRVKPIAEIVFGISDFSTTQSVLDLRSRVAVDKLDQ